MPQVRGSKFTASSPSGKKLAGERRRAHRFCLFVRAAKLLCDGKEHLCLVRDVSVTGVKVQLFGALPSSSNLVLALANGERFAVDLAWREGGLAGLRFDREADLFRLVTLDQGAFPRRLLRLAADLQAQVITGTRSFSATIANVSQQGARISCKANLAAGQTVLVETGTIEPLFARVRWRKRPHYGLIFERTLELEELASLAG